MDIAPTGGVGNKTTIGLEVREETSFIIVRNATSVSTERNLRLRPRGGEGRHFFRRGEPLRAMAQQFRINVKAFEVRMAKCAFGGMLISQIRRPSGLPSSQLAFGRSSEESMPIRSLRERAPRAPLTWEARFVELQFGRLVGLRTSASPFRAVGCAGPLSFAWLKDR